MSFIFPTRSKGRGAMSTHSKAKSATTLPAISEDDATFINPREPPPLPERAANRPKNSLFGQAPRHNYVESPPPYSGFDPAGVEGPKGEKLADIRHNVKNNKFVAKRGGWKKLAVVALVVILVIVGLVVGLVLGLTNKKNSSNKDGSSNTPDGGASGTVGGPGNPASNTTFPAGSYTFDTYLSAVSANCTSNPATWTCYPYTTYAQNPAASAASFDWIISPSADSNALYTISSTANVFSIIFSNISLSLQSAGQSDEHYFFQTTMQKPTKPTSQLGDQNVASTCYFNETTFQGYLYTKQNATYGSSTTANSSDSSQTFAAWPGAVRVEQLAPAGPATPTCLGPYGQSLGDFSVETQSAVCECLYTNTGT